MIHLNGGGLHAQESNKVGRGITWNTAKLIWIEDDVQALVVVVAVQLLDSVVTVVLSS